MSKKTKDQDYICLSAILRAKEAKMLSQAKVDRMLSEPEFSDACRIATESGYEDMSGMDVAGVNAALARHRAQEMAEISEMVPDIPVLDLFRMKYGYHNAKVIVKSKGDIEKNRSLFSDAVRFSIEDLLEVYQAESGNLNGKIPTPYADAIHQAKRALARTGNPQLADYILDKAYFAELQRSAARSGKSYIIDYVKLQIDKANLRSALRTLALDRREDLLSNALIEGGSVSTEEILRAGTTKDALASIFSTTVFGKAAKAPNLMQFEKEAEAEERIHILKSNYVTFGPEVIIEYCTALENEITSLRVILTGKLMGIPEMRLRERLRDSYV